MRKCANLNVQSRRRVLLTPKLLKANSKCIQRLWQPWKLLCHGVRRVLHALPTWTQTACLQPKHLHKRYPRIPDIVARPMKDV